MADSSTTHYGFTQPEVGASKDSWGGKLNDNWADVDGLLGGDAPLTGVDIDSGTIDGTTIGGSTPAAVTGTTITGTGFVTTGDMTFGDNDKAIFGAGSDLRIYHDGSNSYIEEAGTGALKVTSNGTGIDFESAGGETLAQFATNSAVTLYHNNNPKLATTSIGIDVTGTVKSTVSSTGDFNFNAISSGGGNYRIYPDDATTANPTWLHQSNSSEDQAWVIGGVERMRIDSSGNVGIATASPAEALDVTGTGLFSGRVGIGTDLGSNPSGADPDADNLVIDAGGADAGITIDTGTAAKGSLFFADGGTGDALKRGQIVYDHNGDYMAFATNAVERMRIDSSGNVGFGTTSPAENLHVVSTNGTALRLEATNTATAGGIDFYGKDAGGTTYQAGNINAAGGSGSLEFSADPTDAETNTRVTFLTDGTERARIDDTGLGIGTTSPAQALDVTGNAAVSGKAKVGTGADGSANGDEIVISKGGNNIGMTILCADATGNSRIYLGSQTDTQAARLHHSESNDRLFLQAKGDLYFQTGGSGTTMTLNGSGDLDVTGALSKGSGSFKISHPLKPETHHLVHSFLEGPQADNIYRGTVALVDGTATVNLDTAGRMTEGTFVALNGNVQCLTSNEQGWTAVRGSVSGNILSIEAQDATCTDTVSWLVIGERHDQHMIDTHWTDADGRVITEPEKPPVEMDEA